MARTITLQRKPFVIFFFFFFFFFFCVPQLYLWGSSFWVRFLRVWPFFFFFFFLFNPTIEVVTFRLHGLCMLGVFLLPAFTRLGHECQDLLSPCDGMLASTDKTSVYTLIRKSFGGMESEPMLNSKGGIPSTWKILLRGGSNPGRCITFVPPLWPSGKAYASRAEDHRFESRLRRDFFGVKSYQWLQNWHSSGYPARRLVL